MPEYLSPGVYVEETSFRAKSIEGVSTSTAGFVGQCRYGPIEGEPTLITSPDEFERYFGNIEDIRLDGTPATNHLGHAAQLFFANGGKRIWVSRIYRPPTAGPAALNGGVAKGKNMAGGGVRFSARFPGDAGNLKVVVEGVRSGNILLGKGGGSSVTVMTKASLRSNKPSLAVTLASL